VRGARGGVRGEISRDSGTAFRHQVGEFGPTRPREHRHGYLAEDKPGLAVAKAAAMDLRRFFDLFQRRLRDPRARRGRRRIVWMRSSCAVPCFSCSRSGSAWTAAGGSRRGRARVNPSLAR
jgi:hypothetical protein